MWPFKKKQEREKILIPLQMVYVSNLVSKKDLQFEQIESRTFHRDDVFREKITLKDNSNGQLITIEGFDLIDYKRFGGLTIKPSAKLKLTLELLND